MIFVSRVGWGLGLVPALVLVHATPAMGQQDPLDPFDFGVELVGVTVDLDDGETIGDCKWYESRTPGRTCAVTFATFQQQGVPIVEGRESSLTTGDFGPARYRVAGRVTHLHFQKARKEQTVDSGFSVQAPTEQRVATDGSPLPAAAPPERVRNRVRIPPRQEYVTATVTWSLYDSVREEMVATEAVKSGAPELGVTIYDSYVEFLEARKDDLADR